VLITSGGFFSYLNLLKVLHKVILLFIVIQLLVQDKSICVKFIMLRQMEDQYEFLYQLISLKSVPNMTCRVNLCAPYLFSY
jgi:hypothetical protein